MNHHHLHYILKQQLSAIARAELMYLYVSQNKQMIPRDENYAENTVTSDSRNKVQTPAAQSYADRTMSTDMRQHELTQQREHNCSYTVITVQLVSRFRRIIQSGPIYVQGGPAKVRPTYILLVTFGA